MTKKKNKEHFVDEYLVYYENGYNTYIKNLDLNDKQYMNQMNLNLKTD